MRKTLNLSTCRSCEAPIVWAWTANGKRVPLDPEQRPDGNLEIIGDHVDEDGRSAPLVRYLKKGEDLTLLGPGERFVTHFATCPNAEEHRR